MFFFFSFCYYFLLDVRHRGEGEGSEVPVGFSVPDSWQGGAESVIALFQKIPHSELPDPDQPLPQAELEGRNRQSSEHSLSGFVSSFTSELPQIGINLPTPGLIPELIPPAWEGRDCSSHTPHKPFRPPQNEF